MRTLHEGKYTFLIISYTLLLRNVSNRSCRENQNTHFMLNNFPLPLPAESHATYEIMWKKMAEPARTLMVIYRVIKKSLCI
jgi:hypothetical protein